MGGDPSWTNALPVTVQFPRGSMGRQQSSGQHHKSHPQPDIADDMIWDGIPKSVDEESFHMSSIFGEDHAAGPGLLYHGATFVPRLILETAMFDYCEHLSERVATTITPTAFEIGSLIQVFWVCRY